MSHIPGPRSALGLRNTLRFMRDPLAMLRDMTDRYGDIVKIHALNNDWYLINHPRDIETALVRNASIMGRDAYIDILKHTLGQGLLTSEGDLWKRQRRLMAQVFTPKHIRRVASTMATVAEAEVAWDDDAVIALHDEMSRVTMEVVARVLFGATMRSEDVATVGASMEEIAAYYANSPEAVLRLPTRVPTPRNRRLVRAVAEIDAVIYRIIEARRSAPADARDDGDLLGLLLAACDDDGAGMSDTQLRDEAITLFLAGHETTALALAYALMLVSTHPSVARKLRDELDRVLGGRTPEAADVKALVYTERVIKEAMRLYPPAWTIGRAVEGDVTLGEHHIPRGSQLIISQWIVHRDPRFFPNPEAFDPDRWEQARDLPRFAFFPFGGGPRVCIGNHFAMTEAIVILAVVMQRYDLALLPGEQLKLAPSVTLRAKHSLRMRVAKRTQHDTSA